MDQNLKIKAIQSALEASRDELLVELDGLLNGQNNNSVISYTIQKLKELSMINQTINNFKAIIEDNKNHTIQEAIKTIDRIQKEQNLQNKKEE